MSSAVPLVDHPDQLTPEWLSLVFEKSGLSARVRSLQATPVGTGQMADNYRLALELEAPSDDAPGSVVVKVSSADPTSRASGAAGGYATEVRFYQDLADDAGIRTPHCYHADISEAQDVFVLVLEDLAPAEQGDQIRGCDVAEAKLALDDLAALHASHWCDAGLDAFDWLNRVTPEIAAFFTTVMQTATEGFIERYETRLAPGDPEVLRQFADCASTWLVQRPERFGLVHGDYRLDNLLFGTEAGGAPVAAVDWQTLSIALPGRDVGYFLGNSLASLDRRKHEEELVRGYHDALTSRGVADYSFDDCFGDYRLGHFQGPLVTVLGAMAVIQTDRGDDMFMAMCSRTCQAIRDLDSASLL
jgi:aminoglycoside/choline kinase family phosphotransferase